MVPIGPKMPVDDAHFKFSSPSDDIAKGDAKHLKEIKWVMLVLGVFAVMTIIAVLVILYAVPRKLDATSDLENATR